MRLTSTFLSEKPDVSLIEYIFQRAATNKDVILSKTLSWLLRHGAAREGLSMNENGFVAVSEILRHQSLKQYTIQDIQRVVDENDKKRFTLSNNAQTGEIFIKANQGHSMKVVNDSSLKPILNVVDAPIVVHGTYFRNWEQIKIQGLSRMNRLHIHFAPGVPGDAEVISGMRRNCDTYIFINIEEALKDGIKFYRSSNNVILSPGNAAGFIEPKYFSRVVHHS